MDSTTTTRRTARKKHLLLLTAVAGFLAAFGIFLAPSSSAESKLLRTRNTSDDEPASSNSEGTPHNEPRPVMHTFFEKIAEERSNTGMSDKANEDLLEAWSSAWEEAGWETKVLGVEDAKKHEDYERLYPLVDKLPVTDYDKLCYVRWFAMAAVGGGYMSDYDLMPLESSYVDPSRPEKYAAGKFTVYVSSLSGDGIPALVSGSAAEWTRMARGLVEDPGPSAAGNLLPSDMNVLLKIQDKMNVEVRNDVVRGQAVLQNGRELTKEECAKVQGKRGVHFSHRAFVDGFAEDNRPEVEFRPKIIKNWIEMWKRVCMESRIA